MLEAKKFAMTDNSLDRMLLFDEYFELGKMERNAARKFGLCGEEKPFVLFSGKERKRS